LCIYLFIYLLNLKSRVLTIRRLFGSERLLNVSHQYVSLLQFFRKAATLYAVTEAVLTLTLRWSSG